MILQYTPSLLAAAAYSLASYTVSKLLWVPFSLPPIVNYAWIYWPLFKCIYIFFCLNSLITYAPLRVIRWMIFQPALLTSTSFTLVQKHTHIRPSGRSIKAHGMRWPKVPKGHIHQSPLWFSPLFPVFLNSSLCLQILSCFIHHSALRSAFHTKLCYTSLLTLVPNQNQNKSVKIIVFNYYILYCSDLRVKRYFFVFVCS